MATGLCSYANLAWVSSLIKLSQLADLAHLRTELSRKCQIEDELTAELDDCHVLLQAKEADCTRLAKNLGASQVREAEQEAKHMYELQKVRQNLEFKNLRQQQEVCILVICLRKHSFLKARNNYVFYGKGMTLHGFAVHFD